MEKVILTTGGTGGHIFPALSVAEELRKRRPDIELLFMGSFYGPEKGLAAKWNINFEGLNVRGFLGRGPRAVPAAFNMLKALFLAGYKIKKFKPDIVAGFGGYASFAPVTAAWLGGTPVLIHEQNAVAGACNRLLSRLAARVCVSMKGAFGPNEKAVVTGNPARKIFNDVYQKRLTRKKAGKNLLVIGGSQGASALNKFILKNLDAFIRAGVSVRHQTGERDLEATRAAYRERNLDPSRVSAFIENMAGEYEKADVILCRAGASTIAEVCLCGLPAVFVPFPAAIHDHQTKNAWALKEAGAALLITEPELNRDDAVSSILKLFSNSEKLNEMGAAAYKLAGKDAAARLVDCMEEILKRNTGKGSKA